MTNYEMNKKYAEPIKAVLAAMEKDFEEFTNAGFLNNNEATEKFYANHYYFGYGNPESGIRWAEFYMCPESDECMEVSLKNLLDFINEEYPVERIERVEGEVFYYSPSGRKYAIVELIAVGTDTHYDIGILMEVTPGECEDCPEYKTVPGYVYGVASMPESELLEWCRGMVTEYEKKS